MGKPSTDEAGIRQTIRALKAAGYALDHVHDGEDIVHVKTESEAVDAITAVDDADLFVKAKDGSSGWVRFVMGNDPDEVICDHGVNLRPVLDPLMDSWA